jgi:conjugal transfer mating pair stabilization protein TraG
MTQLFTIYTYGGGEVVHNIFNAIAVIYQDGYMEELFQISIMLGLAIAGIKAGITQKHGANYAKWLGGYLFVILILMQPVTIFGNKGMTIYWRDVVTGRADKVDHLPPGLVVPAGIISGLGYSVTKLFETLFSSPMPEYLPYHKYGTTFASQVRADLKDMRIQDPILRENLESYISNCVKYDTMIGNIYDINNLANAENIWLYLEEHSSNLRMFNYRLPKHGGRELINCRTGVAKLASSFNKEAELLAQKFPSFSRLMHSRATSDANAKNGFLKALEVTGKFYDNKLNGSASDQLRQILFINQFKTNPHSYGTVRAMQAQNSNWMLLGDIGQLALPILHAIFQALIYASFPIIVTILFFSQRYQTLKTYFEMMIWIELWPLLFAILNGAVSIFARRAGIDEVITINSMDNIVNTQSMYAMMAYGMGLSIPAFAYMITKGGVGQFVHMAGSLMSATQHGAATAATELATGNRSLDNVNIGNRSYNNVSANKYDTSGSVATGFIRTRMPTGAMMTENMFNDLHGGRTFQTGQGFDESSLPVTLSEMKNSSVQDENRFSEVQSKVYGQREMVSESQKEAQSQAASWMLRNYDHVLRDKSNVISEQGSRGEKLVEVANQTKNIAEDYGYSKEQMASIGIGGNIGLGVGSGRGAGNAKGKDSGGAVLSRVGGLFSGGISASADGKVSDTDRQGLSEGLSVLEVSSNDKVLDAINSYSRQNSLKEGQGDETSDSKTFNHAYDEYKQKQQTLEVMENESKQLQKSMAVSKSSAFQVATNNQQEFFNYFTNHGDWTSSVTGKKFGDREALSHIQKRDKVFEDVVDMYGLWKEGKEAKKAGTLQYQQEKYEQDSEYSSGIKNMMKNTEVKNKTNSAIISQEYIEKPELSSKDESIKQVVDQKLSANKAKISQKGEEIQNTKSNLENKTDAADDSIIGKYARNKGLVGTQNQFVKNRKNENNSDK